MRKKKSKKDVRNEKKKKKEIKRERYTYFSLLQGFFSTRILRVRVQGSGHTDDEDLPACQCCLSPEQILKQLEPDFDSDTPSQDIQKL